MTESAPEKPGFELLKPEAVLALDEALATYNEQLPRLQEFILPAGTRGAALAHVCRTAARLAPAGRRDGSFSKE